MKSHPRFAGIGGHHAPLSRTVEWLTPPSIIAALGPFDLDPCAPIEQPYPTASKSFTIKDNGLTRVWAKRARVWCNPPYSSGVIDKWLARMAEHDHGTALIFARTETDAFFRYVWECCSALLFIRGRINFHLPDGSRAKANSGAPSVLCAYGMTDCDVLAGCGLEGQFVPLRFPRSVLVEALSPTWRQALAGWFQRQHGPIELAELYRAFAGHPKTKSNPTWQATIRRTLQEGPFRNVGRGQWEFAK